MTNTPIQQFEDGDWVLKDHDWSNKAWMSVKDANLFEALLLHKAGDKNRLEILEWGSGRSTIYYSKLLAALDSPFRWLSLEYDRAFFCADVEPQLNQLANPTVYHVEDDTMIRLDTGPIKSHMVEFAVFNKGKLLPMLRAHPSDRNVNMRSEE